MTQPLHKQLIAELDDEIEGLTLNALSQTKSSLYSIISRINEIQNSITPINNLAPNVLYNIFTLAVHSEPTDFGMTTLNLSHVCCHWRKSALGWPTLWGFVNLNRGRSFVDLFMSRSQNASLTFSYHSLQSQYNSALPTHNLESCMLYLQSCANLVLPRITALTLHGTSHDFSSFRDKSEKFGLLPVSKLDINLFGKESHNFLLPNMLQIDTSCLRQLKLQRVGLPLSWLEFSPNKLTHFLFVPREPPPLPQLTTFLSTCLLLDELDIRIADFKSESIIVKPTTILNFPNLRRLILVPRGKKLLCHRYIQALLACIESLDHLSQFLLKSPGQERHDQSVSKISEFVRIGTSRFAGHRYLHVCFNERWHEIISKPSQSSHVLSPDLFYLGGIDYDSILTFELVHQLPSITHLVLQDEACGLLVSPEFDFCNLFPCLTTLQLAAHRYHPTVTDNAEILEKLSLLPVINLETLIVRCDGKTTLSEFLPCIISRIKTEVLKLWMNEEHYSGFVANLVDAQRMKGVSVFLLSGSEEGDQGNGDWAFFDRGSRIMFEALLH